MSITDELREWMNDNYPAWRKLRTGVSDQLDRIDEAHEEAIQREHETAYDKGYDDGFASADDWCAQHEDAMAEHGWVRGPLDADGKMWRSGDMSDSNWGVIEGIAYEDGRWLVSGHDTSAPWVPADSIRHYHEPTVEDVLREFYVYAERGAEHHREDVDDAVLAEYAAKLQLRGDGE